MPQLQQEGTFRGVIVEYGLREQKSGAKAISIIASIDEAWDQETSQWVDWREHALEVSGDLWVVKKDGTLNLKQVEALVRYAGFNGDLVGVVEGSWQPTPCQFDVTRNEYQENVRFRVAWIAGFDRTPGSMGNVSPERARELQELYGPQFRAIAGNFARNATPAAGKPKVPKAGPAKRPIMPVDPAEVAEAEEDAEPF